MTIQPYARSVTGRVIGLKRRRSSVNGNPAFDVTIITESGDELTHATSSDVMLSYAIGNAEFRDRAHEFGLTRDGRLNGYARPVPVTDDARFAVGETTLREMHEASR